MKRILSLFLCLFVLFVSFVCAAETPAESTAAFDKTVFEASPLYSYDKFNKTWTVQAHWVKEYTNATLRFHVLLFDVFLEKDYTPELFVEFFNKDYQDYDEVTAFRVIVGEKLYCFEQMDNFRETGASAYGGIVLRNMLNKLNTSEEVALQLEVTDKYGVVRTYTVDPVSSESLSEIKTIGKLLEESNYWTQYADSFLASFDSYYSASEE